LVPIFIPDEQTEAIRDLERAREDAKKAERAARHQLSKFLLRNNRRYAGKTNWTNKHMAWIAQERFAEPAQQYVLNDGLATVETATLRCQKLVGGLRESVKGWRLEPLVRALQAMRGIEFITAVTLVAEIGDYRRFLTAGDFMGYLGLIPSE